jgi:hypothetical protein
MVYALGLPPNALAAGLTKEQFRKEIMGKHNLAQASLVGRYERDLDGRAVQAAK